MNGDDRHPLYTELTGTPDADGEAGDIQWNFEKFLLDRDGDGARPVPAGHQPDDPAVIQAIEKSSDRSGRPVRRPGPQLPLTISSVGSSTPRAALRPARRSTSSAAR